MSSAAALSFWSQPNISLVKNNFANSALLQVTPRPTIGKGKICGKLIASANCNYLLITFAGLKQAICKKISTVHAVVKKRSNLQEQVSPQQNSACVNSYVKGLGGRSIYAGAHSTCCLVCTEKQANQSEKRGGLPLTPSPEEKKLPAFKLPRSLVT